MTPTPKRPPKGRVREHSTSTQLQRYVPTPRKPKKK